MPRTTDIETADQSVGLLQQHPNDGWIPADPYPMGNMSVAALTGVVNALSPAEDPFDRYQERVQAHVRLQMRYMHPLVARVFLLSLHLLDWAPLWRFKSFRRLRHLSREKGSAVIQGMAHSRLGLMRMMVMGVRAMVGTCIYDQKEVHQRLEYAPEPWMKKRIELRKRLVAGEEPSEGDKIGPYSKLRVIE